MISDLIEFSMLFIVLYFLF